MNPKLLISIGTVCLAGAAASAAIQGLIAEGTLVTIGSDQLYAMKLSATFSDPGDRVVGISAAEGVATFTYYQNPWGTDTEPQSFLFSLDPKLQYDSFVTVGQASTSRGPWTALLPGADYTTTLFPAGWSSTVDGPHTLAGADGKVPLAQITALNPAPGHGTKASVGLILDWVAADGTPHSTYLERHCIGLLTPILCPALSTEIDFNDDCVVNGLDLADFLAHWGVPCGSPFEGECPGDFSNDGVVSGLDLAVLLSRWGPIPVCPPK